LGVVYVVFHGREKTKRGKWKKKMHNTNNIIKEPGQGRRNSLVSVFAPVCIFTVVFRRLKPQKLNVSCVIFFSNYTTRQIMASRPCIILRIESQRVAAKALLK
jgi:hypothetical protein